MIWARFSVRKLGRKLFWPKLAWKFEPMTVSGRVVELASRGRSSLAYWRMSSLERAEEKIELTLPTIELNRFFSSPLTERASVVKVDVRLSPFSSEKLSRSVTRWLPLACQVSLK